MIAKIKSVHIVYLKRFLQEKSQQDMSVDEYIKSKQKVQFTRDRMLGNNQNILV